MSLIRADIPTIVIGMKDIGFENAGINKYNTYKIIKIADPFESYNPLDPINPITGFEKDAAYFFFAKETIDLTGIADNAIPSNLDTTSGNNVFANMAFAGVAKTTATFATVGFNTSNLLWIYKVSDPYESYNPNDPYNPIDGFEEGECYYGYALADMDLTAYLIPPIVIKDDIEKTTGTYKYYGTEATTVKDYYNVPVRFFADEASLPATGVENIVYVAKAEKTSWYWDGAAYQKIGGGGSSYTDEQAQDAVGTILSSEFTYDDVTPQISINQIAYSKLTGTPTIPTQYTDEMAQDATAAMIAAGTHTGITFTYDDAGNKISAAVTGGAETDPLSVHLTGTSTATGDMTLDLGTTNEFYVTANQTNKTAFKATNAHATGGTGIEGVANGSGNGVQGTSSSGAGLSGQSTSGKGVYGLSTSSYGVQGQTSSGYGLGAYRFGSGTTDKVGLLEILRFSSGTGANGFGAYIDWTLESSDTFAYLAGRYGAYWKDATTATRKGALSEVVTYNTTSVTTQETCSGYLVTSNATPAVMSTVNIDDETCGIIEVYIVARHSTTSGMVVGKKIMSYIKDGGTLTLGTATTVLTDEITGSCIGSSYSISVVSNQLSISVTGVAATIINWKATIKIVPNS